MIKVSLALSQGIFDPQDLLTFGVGQWAGGHILLPEMQHSVEDIPTLLGTLGPLVLVHRLGTKHALGRLQTLPSWSPNTMLQMNLGRSLKNFCTYEDIWNLHTRRPIKFFQALQVHHHHTEGLVSPCPVSFHCLFRRLHVYLLFLRSLDFFEARVVHSTLLNNFLRPISTWWVLAIIVALDVAQIIRTS